MLTIFWFMGMINTVNWLDGLDGLAAGVSAIVAAFLAIHMIREGQFSVALLPVALLGATLGFLPFNFNPARVFMGSSGSYFLGWALAALGIIGGAKVATVLLVMGLPILDVAWLIYNRWRRGGQPGVGGRDHLHYRLLDIGFTQRQIVLGYYAFCATVRRCWRLGLENRLFKLVALLVLARQPCWRCWLWAEQAARGEVSRRTPERRLRTIVQTKQTENYDASIAPPPLSLTLLVKPQAPRARCRAAGPSPRRRCVPDTRR